MNKYKIYFTIYGKKMVAEVNATNTENAKQVVKDKVFFDKIECTFSDPQQEKNNRIKEFYEKTYGKKDSDISLDALKDLFGGFGK